MRFPRRFRRRLPSLPFLVFAPDRAGTCILSASRFQPSVLRTVSPRGPLPSRAFAAPPGLSPAASVAPCSNVVVVRRYQRLLQLPWPRLAWDWAATSGSTMPSAAIRVWVAGHPTRCMLTAAHGPRQREAGEPTGAEDTLIAPSNNRGPLLSRRYRPERSWRSSNGSSDSGPSCVRAGCRRVWRRDAARRARRRGLCPRVGRRGVHLGQ